MKQLEVSMKVELQGSDLRDAILHGKSAEDTLTEILSMSDVLQSYVKTFKKDVSKAVDTWLADNHKLKADKIIYDNGRVLAEVHGLNGPAPLRQAAPAPVKKATPTKLVKKPNQKIFDFIREYLDDERKKGVNEITFDTLFKDAKFFYPKLTARLLQIYLHDRRQLKNIDFAAGRGTVLLK